MLLLMLWDTLDLPLDPLDPLGLLLDPLRPSKDTN